MGPIEDARGDLSFFPPIVMPNTSTKGFQKS